jgi:hypothetical protein
MKVKMYESRALYCCVIKGTTFLSPLKLTVGLRNANNTNTFPEVSSYLKFLSTHAIFRYVGKTEYNFGLGFSAEDASGM